MNPATLHPSRAPTEPLEPVTDTTHQVIRAMVHDYLREQLALHDPAVDTTTADLTDPALAHPAFELAHDPRFERYAIRDARQLVGFLFLYEWNTAFEVLDIFVRSGWRRRGIGARAMAAAQDMVTRRNTPRLTVRVPRGNADGEAFFQGVAFSYVSYDPITGCDVFEWPPAPAASTNRGYWP